jgi:hypothetical protein
MKQGKVAEKRVHKGWDNRKRKKSKLQEEEKSERRSEVKERKRRYVKDEMGLGENEMKRKMRKKSRNRCWCCGDDGWRNTYVLVCEDGTCIVILTHILFYGVLLN